MMYKKPYQQSIVQIFDENNDVIGTGVIIAKKYILTCGHVICDALSMKHEDIKATIDKKITIGLHNSNKKSKQQAKTLHAILNEDSNKNTYNDIALLLLDEEINIPNYPLIEVRKSSLDVKIFGFDEYHGRWVNAKYIGNNFSALGQINPELNNIMDYGFSGAPVWDEENNGIIGIIVAKKKWIQDEKELIKESYLITESYMIPSSTILEVDEFKKYLGSYIRPRNPYKGLNSFGEKDSQFYFGRNDEVSKVMSKLSLNSKYRFFSIIGISGVGKSSFLNAGLIPILKNNFEYTVISLRPSSNPFEEMASKLIEHLEEDKTQHAKKTRKMQEDFSTTENISGIRDQLKVISKEISPVIIIIDQFEELFTNSSKKVQSLFLMQLLEIINDKDLPVQIVISMRVDFLEKLLNYPEYINILNDDTKHFIGNLESEKLKDIILKPAHIQDVRFEDGVIERILNDIENVKGKLPLLEFALTKLWENQEYGVITNKALDEIGGVVTSLGKYAEDVFNEFETEEEKESVRRVMIQLIHPGAGAKDTRQIATFNNFIDEDRKTITELANKRLIVTGSEENKITQQVEIIHEALITQWSTLKKWIDEDREFRLWQNKLRLTIDDWIKGAIYDESYLLRGRQLEEAEEKLELFPKELEPDKDFIKKSIEARDIQLELENLEVEKKIKRNRQIKIGVTTFVIALSATTVISFYQKNIADIRLDKIDSQQDNMIGAYWATLLNTDIQKDGKIDNIELLNLVINLVNYPKDKKEKALNEILPQGVVSAIQNPKESKNLADFNIIFSDLAFSEKKYITEKLDNGLSSAIWSWNSEQLDLLLNFLTKVIDGTLPKLFKKYENIDKENLENIRYIVHLFSFINNPTKNKLNVLIKNKRFIKEGLENLTDFEEKIKENYTFMKDMNSFDIISISKNNLNKIQSISRILYHHSIQNSTKYTKEQKKDIENMYFYGIYKLDSNQINKKEYFELNTTLPYFFKKNVYRLRDKANLLGAKKELNKILEIQKDNYSALYEKLYIHFLERKQDQINKLTKKMINLFPTKIDNLRHVRKVMNLVLNNQNLNPITFELTKEEKDSLHNYYGWISSYFIAKKDYEKAHLNIKLSIKYSPNDKSAAMKYGSVTWHYILIKKYEEAIRFGKKGINLYPKLTPNLTENLAHAYLLNGDIEEAKAIYLNPKYKDRVVQKNTLWRVLIQNDFKTFKENNISSPFFNEIEKELFLDENL